jgi:hypothetical protein
VFQDISIITRQTLVNYHVVKANIMILFLITVMHVTTDVDLALWILIETKFAVLAQLDI